MEGYIDENNWIDLSALPRVHGNSIYWDKSIGMTVPFKYQGKSGEMTILERLREKHGVRVFVENYTDKNGYTLETYALRHCKLSGLLRKNILVDAPHVIKYLTNQSDKLLPCGSQKIINAKCPICGFEKPISVSRLVKNGLSCNRCSDGISYPNKFMLNLLDQIGQPYQLEISKKTNGYYWLQNYRYDFHIEINQNNYFIEMDGGFHFINKIADDALIKQKESDQAKDLLAKEHNHNVIRIDCNYLRIENRYTYIKNNILKSELSHILDLSNINIDWDACDKAGCMSLYIKACDYWNSGITCVTDIARILHLDPETIRRYLKGGTRFGLCDYDPQRALLEAGHKRARPIAVYDYLGNICGVFENYIDLVNKSMMWFGKTFKKSTVFACCGGHMNTAYGYMMKYISKEEYKEYILYNNSTVQN